MIAPENAWRWWPLQQCRPHNLPQHAMAFQIAFAARYQDLERMAELSIAHKDLGLRFARSRNMKVKRQTMVSAYHEALKEPTRQYALLQRGRSASDLQRRIDGARRVRTHGKARSGDISLSCGTGGIEEAIFQNSQ